MFKHYHQIQDLGENFMQHCMEIGLDIAFIETVQHQMRAQSKLKAVLQHIRVCSKFFGHKFFFATLCIQ